MANPYVFSIGQSAILGTVQGLTEFLPISSSAHLKLVPWFLGWRAPDKELAFDVALHLGTLIALLAYFFLDYFVITAHYIGDLRQKRWLGGPKGSLLPKLVVATIPGAVAGLLFEKKIEATFYGNSHHIWVLAVTLSVFGLLLLIAEKRGKQNRELTDITYRDALLIGCAQALALIPGVSRSGVTIFCGLLFSLTRPAAARFSFLLAVPITAGAVVAKMPDFLHSAFDWSLVVGTASSAIVGLLAIMFLLKYVQTHSYAIFVYYRWILAAAIIATCFQRGDFHAQEPSPQAHTQLLPKLPSSTWL